jgi:uncharacterized membrane protein
MHKGLIGIAFLGLLISGYLFITYVSPEQIKCISGEGCKIAQLSEYSSFLGVPTPAYGIAFYLALGVLGALWSENTRKKVLPALVILTGTGLAVSIFLSGVEAFVLKAWCSWCVASALLSIAAFLMTSRLVLISKKDSYGTHI